MAEQFRIGDLEILALGEDQHLIRPKTGGPPLVLPENDARLLASCGVYCSLEDHARSWAVQLDRRKIRQAEQNSPRWLARVLEAGAKAAEPSANNVASTLEKLRNFAGKGLLIPRSTFLAELCAHAQDAPSQPIAALGFTTRSRTAELRRALDSYAANFRRHDRSPEILILDDSRDSRTESETEHMLRDFQRESDFVVRFAGMAEREAYAAALAREARIAPAIARFVLIGDERCNVTTGSARNALLLDCASVLYVLADDDGLCRLVRTPEARDGLDLVSQNDPTQFWFFESRDALHDSLAFTDEPDLFGVHETLLGRPLGHVDGSVDLDLAGASPAFEARLRRRGGTVRTTMAGVAGDSGVASTAYLHVEPRSRSRLTVSESFYHAAVASRQMLRAPQRTTVSEGFLTMAGNLGIDATHLFPPFPPVQRNSDGIVGRLLQVCFPGSCRGYLSWSVLHDPVGIRSQSLDHWFEEIRSIRFADVLTVFLRDTLDEPGDDSAAALHVAGDRLSRLGRLRPDTFREELRGRLLTREAARLAQLRKAPPSETPGFYRDLQERYNSVMQQALTRDDFLSPRDLPGGSLSLAQNLAGQFGDMLAVWPRLFHAALWLRTNGRRLTRPIA